MDDNMIANALNNLRASIDDLPSKNDKRSQDRDLMRALQNISDQLKSIERILDRTLDEIKEMSRHMDK
ncbi:hypothetical protein HYV73_02910 [Candidatus Uhrbacteria bacterium]|nr:hypothetical protein [Candidatus Uhrbacteria bacterium]